MSSSSGCFLFFAASEMEGVKTTSFPLKTTFSVTMICCTKLSSEGSTLKEELDCAAPTVLRTVICDSMGLSALTILMAMRLPG